MHISKRSISTSNAPCIITSGRLHRIHSLRKRHDEHAHTLASEQIVSQCRGDLEIRTTFINASVLTRRCLFHIDNPCTRSSLGRLELSGVRTPIWATGLGLRLKRMRLCKDRSHLPITQLKGLHSGKLLSIDCIFAVRHISWMHRIHRKIRAEDFLTKYE